MISAYWIRDYEEFFCGKETKNAYPLKNEDIIHGAIVQNGEGLFDKCKTVYDNSTADVVFVSARTEMVQCWKRLKELHLIDRTVLILDESSAVDWKCGTFFLKHFQRSFPAFLTYRDDFIDYSVFFPIRPIGNIVDSIEPSLDRFDQRRLLCMICANKSSRMPNEMYSVREKCIAYFERHLSEEFDLYGPWWGDKYSNWKGIIKDKKDTYHKHKFALCVENSYEPGYITEKIFDCFRYGIVPVYAGPPNIDKFIPSDSYISFYRFETIDKLVGYLKNVSEEEYKDLLECAKRFIESKQYLRMFGDLDELLQMCSEIPLTHRNGIRYSQVKLAGLIDSMIQIVNRAVEYALKLKKCVKFVFATSGKRAN